jgi:hypothetical protein
MCGVGTCIIKVKPTKDQWDLDDATVKPALHYMPVVSPGPHHQVFFPVCMWEHKQGNRYFTSCDKLATAHFMRYNLLQSTVHCGSALLNHRSSVERSCVLGMPDMGTAMMCW